MGAVPLSETVRRLRAHPVDLVTAVRTRLTYDNHSLGLRRDLTEPFPAPPAKIALTVRPLADRDVAGLLDPQAPGLEASERVERAFRTDLLASGLGTAWVAVTDDDEAAYVQWIIGPEQDALLQRHFHGTFPRLAADEALLEGAYTPSTHRGQRVMAHAMARIAEQAGRQGARHVLTFVSRDNTASLAGCRRAGFSPVMTRHESWRAFRRTVAFGPLPVDAVAAETGPRGPRTGDVVQ